jgi:hypothetical protein
VEHPGERGEIADPIIANHMVPNRLG